MGMRADCHCDSQRSEKKLSIYLLCLLIFGIVIFEISACYEVDNPKDVFRFIQCIIFNVKIEADIFYLYSYAGEVKKINHFLN